jgi:hypothetical protein
MQHAVLGQIRHILGGQHEMTMPCEGLPRLGWCDGGLRHCWMKMLAGRCWRAIIELDMIIDNAIT